MSDTVLDRIVAAVPSAAARNATARKHAASQLERESITGPTIKAVDDPQRHLAAFHPPLQTCFDADKTVII